MDNTLYFYLEQEWRYRNHKKYQIYFRIWIENLTYNQIEYFRKDMLKLIN